MPTVTDQSGCIQIAMKRFCLTVLGVLALAAVACSSGSSESKRTVLTEPAKRTGGIDLAGMDRSVPPGDDFFQFANGTWFKTTEIPADKSSYGPWAILTDQALQRTRELIDAIG